MTNTKWLMVNDEFGKFLLFGKYKYSYSLHHINYIKLCDKLVTKGKGKEAKESHLTTFLSHNILRFCNSKARILNKTYVKQQKQRPYFNNMQI